MKEDDVKQMFFSFVREHCGNPDSGTSTSYCTAIDKLCAIFSNESPIWVKESNVWEIHDSSEIMNLYEKVKEEQNIFKKDRSISIFAPYAGRGDSYYRKGWCSAALKFFAAYLDSLNYDNQLDNVFNSNIDGNEVAKESEKVCIAHPEYFIGEKIKIDSKKGKECIRQTKVRLNQDKFRRWILSIYSNKCCITGLNIPQILRASHISPWSEDKINRMNPSNGLCLSATYDAAFDKHLISFDDDYRMVLSSYISDYCTKDVCNQYFKKFEGARLAIPSRFLPDKNLLEKHRAKLL